MKTVIDVSVTDEIMVRQLRVSAYKIPTDLPEGDGTFKWNSTTLVLVEIDAGDKTGIGYTYADAATAYFIEHSLKDLVLKKNVMDNQSITIQMGRHIRNNGHSGIAMMAISAIDCALWDVKARILGVPLCQLLGRVREHMMVYGSGGFTTYTDQQLAKQFEGWLEKGIGFLKMKIGANPDKDEQRVRAASALLPAGCELFVDANGAYTATQALQKAQVFAGQKVTWFEEPVSSDNLEGLQFIRNKIPSSIRIAAGEYGYNLPYFQHMLDSGTVDVLQADATRCGGLTAFIKAGHLCEAWQIPLSSHCAPALHLHAAISLPAFFIAEYFHDHVRIENMLFDGARQPVNGVIYPDLERPGLGIEFKFQDASRFQL